MRKPWQVKNKLNSFGFLLPELNQIIGDYVGVYVELNIVQNFFINNFRSICFDFEKHCKDRHFLNFLYRLQALSKVGGLNKLSQEEIENGFSKEKKCDEFNLFEEAKSIKRGYVITDSLLPFPIWNKDYIDIFGLLTLIKEYFSEQYHLCREMFGSFMVAVRTHQYLELYPKDLERLNIQDNDPDKLKISLENLLKADLASVEPDTKHAIGEIIPADENKCYEVYVSMPVMPILLKKLGRSYYESGIFENKTNKTPPSTQDSKPFLKEATSYEWIDAFAKPNHYELKTGYGINIIFAMKKNLEGLLAKSGLGKIPVFISVKDAISQKFTIGIVITPEEIKKFWENRNNGSNLNSSLGKLNLSL